MKNLNVILLALLSLAICFTSCQKEETLVNSGVEQLMLSTAENAKSGASTCQSCPSGTSTGGQLITNGDFSQGNTGFSCDFEHLPNAPTMAHGHYSIRHSGNLANDKWCARDHTAGATYGKFLAMDGGATVTYNAVVTPGLTYSFCAVVNNLVCNPNNYSDPVIVVKQNGQTIVGPITLTESPDEWVLLSNSFVATSSQLTLTIESTSHQMLGNDWALDDVSLVACCRHLNPTFNLSPSSNFAGEVTVSATAVSNLDPAYHWWDIFNSSNGSVSDNSEVPNNSTICCNSSTITFSNNLVVNKWYYIKHGVWNECKSWVESRKAFRVQHYYAKDGSPSYEVEVKDIDFEPTESYLKEMEKMSQELEN